jgi:pimeloyl-ACP methyl ester carboxylesterase
MILSLLFAAVSLAAQPQTSSVSSQGGAISGTLLVPDAKQPVPVVLLIAGSGPTDRDGNSPMLPGRNDSLKMLATDFAMNGIATLRYDKRGIGQSAEAMTKESDLRFETYIDDAVAWCNQLHDDKRFSGVIIASHSEGSLIGMIAARKCRAAGFISLEGAGHTAADILRTQLKGRLPENLATENESILKSLEAGKTVENTPPQLASLYRPSVQPYLISWFKYDPAKEIAALTMPVLIIQGTTDIQMSVDDAKRMAAANPRAKLVIIEGMNHILKTVSGDMQAQIPSYSDPKLQLNEKLTPALVQFVRSATKKRVGAGS